VSGGAGGAGEVGAAPAQSLLDTMRDRFGLSGGSATAVALVANRDETRGTLSVVGFVLIIGSAIAFTRALQRVYERAWDLPKLGLRGVWRGIAWLVGLLAYLGVLTAAVQVTRSPHVGGAIGLVLWWWTPFLLLGGRVRWRALAPGALITGFAQLVLSEAWRRRPGPADLAVSVPASGTKAASEPP
jgi:membrane protein